MIFKLRDTKTQQALPVPEGTLTVGREENNDIVVPDPSISRRHAHLINSSEGLFVEDLGSSNGTAVRGEFISGLTQVNVGDIVFFGSISFRIEPEATAGKPTPAPAPAKAESPAAASPAPVKSASEKGRVGIHFDSVPLPAATTPPTPAHADEGNGLSEEVPVPAESMTTLQLPRIAPGTSNPNATKSGPISLPAPVNRGSSPSRTPASTSPRPSGRLPSVSQEEDSGQPPMPSPWTGWVLAFLVGLMIGIVVGFLLARFVVV